jgi:hypothetical protein
MVAQNLVSQTAPMSIQSYVRQLKYMDQLDHHFGVYCFKRKQHCNRRLIFQSNGDYILDRLKPAGCTLISCS